jgi:hypothetical protein
MPTRAWCKLVKPSSEKIMRNTNDLEQKLACDCELVGFLNVGDDI